MSTEIRQRREVKVPRVNHPFPMYIRVRGEAPVRMRDDLDPYDPPCEYASGKLLWSHGAATREERDRLRAAACEREVAEARQALAEAERRKIAEARRRYRQCAGHAPQRVEGPFPFFGPVAKDENPAAHGNVELVDVCRCGGRRRRLVNQHHEEVGEWGFGL